MNFNRITRIWFVAYALATFVAILMLFTGCTYHYPNTHNNIGTAVVSVPEGRSQYALINNTGLKLRMTQDGRYVGDIVPGQVVPVKGPLLWQQVVVIVSAYYPDGTYVGSAKWIYQFGIPEVWTIDNLSGVPRY